MQVTSHPQTRWTIDQMMNKPFESNGKNTPDKNEAKNASFFFFLSCMAQGVLLKYILFCMFSDQHLRDIEGAVEISLQRSTRNIANILLTVQRNIKKISMEKSKIMYSLQRKERESN